MLRGLSFIFQDLATLVLQSGSLQFYRLILNYSDRFDIRALFSRLGQKMQLNRDYFLQLLKWINLATVHRLNLIQYLKLHPGLVFIVGMVNPIVDVRDHSKMNFMKVVKIQFLFQ